MLLSRRGAAQFPLAMAANKLIPSVVTGNTVVVKPSPYTPLSTAMLAEMAVEAFPAGVMNIMTGGDELGQMMVEHPNIAQISFAKICGPSELHTFCWSWRMQRRIEGA